MLTIDGSRGEGGGQILRTALSLSLVTGTPFRMTSVRAGRAKPGLLRQHLTALQTAAELSNATVEGDVLGSREVLFRPRAVKPGSHRFAVGTAGSAMLVVQTILPALMLVDSPSSLEAEGGTHNPWAPPFEFFDRCFLPLVRRLGARVSATLERPGFHPAGGGRVHLEVQPGLDRNSLSLLDRGPVVSTSALALVSQLPTSIALRELDTLAAELGWERTTMRPECVRDAHGPGNVLLAFVQSAEVTEVFSGFGQRGISAEQVARETAARIRRYWVAGVPVGEHLADQLLLPLALFGGGEFRTLAPSSHTLSQVDTMTAFLGPCVELREESSGVARAIVSSAI